MNITRNWTETNVLKLRPSVEKADCKVKHPVIAGLAIRFRNGGVGTYTFYYSIGGRDQTIKIGKVGAVTLEFAESEAKDHAAKVSKSINPVVERVKAIADLSGAMRDLIEPFLQSQRDKGRSTNWIGRQDNYLNIYFAALHSMPIKMIDRPTVARELEKIKAQCGKIAMTNARATLSKFFSWAISQGHCDHHPVSGTEKIISVPRERVLVPKELAIIWREAGDDEHGRIVKLIMLTAARRNQIGRLRRHELNEKDALITLGGQIGIREAKRLAKLGETQHESLSKNRKTFLIPLSRQALTILAQHPNRPNSAYVFGNGKGEGGYSGWSKSMAELKERIGDRVKADWGLHDIRRSFETLGQDLLKIAPHISDACINHKPSSVKSGTRKHYNFATYLDERIVAMQAWGDYLESLVKPELRIVA